MKAIDQVDFSKLKEAIKDINGADLLQEKIKYVGVGKEDLVNTFTAAVEAIGEAEESGKLAASTIEFYNDLYADEATEAAAEPAETVVPAEAAAEPVAEAAAEAAAEPAETVVPAAEPAKAAKATKATKAAKATTKQGIRKKGERGERFLYVQSLLESGQHTRKEIVAMFLERYPEAKKTTIGTYLSDAKNPKYNQFSHLIQVAEDGKLSFKKG
jgi:hypothetical protein